MLVLLSIFTSCDNSGKQKIRIYIPIVESNTNISTKLFLYTQNDSTFCYCFETSTLDVINYGYLTHGKIERNGNLRIFYDELGRRIFTAALKDDNLLIKSGLFKGIKLIEVDTADYFEEAEYILQDIDNKEPVASPENVIEYFTNNNLINKNFKFRGKSSINLSLNLEDDGSFNMYFDSNLLIRSGHYIANNGIYTFYDTIIPSIEQAVAVFDSSIYSINFGFYDSYYLRLGNYNDLRRADTMRYKLGLIKEYPMHHNLPRDNFIVPKY
jgi:hypothetical protein